MTREEKARRIEELEQELERVEKVEVDKTIIYFNKKERLRELENAEEKDKQKEDIGILKEEINKITQELVCFMRRKEAIRMELMELSKEHRYLQYAESKRR